MNYPPCEHLVKIGRLAQCNHKLWSRPSHWVVPNVCKRCRLKTVRPDLATIELTLPPHKEGRDRKFIFEEDGTVVYEKNDNLEEPRDINGYQRDPNNPYRFTPLWPICTLRHGVGIRYAKCGCINIIMRCNNPAALKFMDRVSHEQCQNCQWRTP